MAISYLAAAADVDADSLAIPVTNLSGFNTFNKFNGVNANLALARFLQGFLEKTKSVLTTDEIFALGMTLTKDLDDPAAATENIIISVWTVVYQRLVKYDGTVRALPVPTGGTSAGVGDFALTEIFTGIEKVADGDPVTADSVVIPVADIQPYGSPAFAGINLAVGQDNRDLWQSILLMLINSVPTRSALVQSAITAKTIAQPTIPNLSAALTQETNPTSGINSADLFSKAFVVSQAASVSIQSFINFENNTNDVNFV